MPDILVEAVRISQEGTMAKTLVDIDPAVLERALDLSGIRTKKELVTVALEQMIRRMERERYLEFILAGNLADLADPEVIRGAQR
jgi:Arc/MetJ family transcription regulator